MDEQIFDYGDYKLDRYSLIHNINNNLEGFIQYKNYSKEEKDLFINAVKYITAGILKGTISKDLEFVPSKPGLFRFVDTEGGITLGDKIHEDVLRFINTIAIALGKNSANEALLRKREKAKAKEKEKEVQYGNFEDFFVKSINPNAKGITDPNLDWASWTEANKGNEGAAIADIVKNFIEKGNPDPSTKGALEEIIIGLSDNDISAKDKLNMNKAGWRAPFYNFVFKGVSGGGGGPKDPKDPNGDKGGNNGDAPKDDGLGTVEPPVVDWDKFSKDPSFLVPNAINVTKEGQWYIEGVNANRKKYMLLNNQFVEVPLTFINDSGLNHLKTLLLRHYRNRFQNENMELAIENFKNKINELGLSHNDATFALEHWNWEETKTLVRLLRQLGASALDIRDLIVNTHTLKSPLTYMQHRTGVRANREGGIIKAQTGTELTYKSDNELYKSLYKEGITSVGLKNADNSLRSKNLKFNTTYKDELDLNNYYKQYKLYSNPEDRHKDFIGWANKYYQDGDTIISLLNRYNDSIDSMYRYKQSDKSNVYSVNGSVVKTKETSDFNKLYNDHYTSANANVFGYDPNSVEIAGSATMARHPDITDEDIAMDFSTHEITNENLKKLLTENKLTKTKTGHYITTIPEKDQGTGVVPGDKLKGVVVDEDDFKMPPKEKQLEVSPEHSELKSKIPGVIGNFIDTINTNNKMLDMNEELDFAILNPIHGHRSIFGNLRALAEANLRAALRTNLARSMFTSDNSLNVAMLYDAFNLNVADWQLALAVDDNAIRESSEKSYLLNRENYLYNQNVYWGNAQRATDFRNGIIQGRINKERANLDSRVNFVNEISDLVNAELEKRALRKRSANALELYAHILKSPISYIDGWNEDYLKLWDRYNAGENITNPRERQIISHIQTLILLAYMRKLFPNDVLSAAPTMSTLRLGVPPQPKIEIKEDPAKENPATKEGKRGMKLIPYMRKKY